MTRCHNRIATAFCILVMPIFGCAQRVDPVNDLTESVVHPSGDEDVATTIQAPSLGPDQVIANSTTPRANQATSASPAELAEEAMLAHESGDLERADRLIRKAITVEPHDPDINFVMGAVLASENRFAEAIHLLDKLVKFHPQVALPVLGQTGEWMELQGEWEKAESRYRSILAEIPDAAAAHRKLAFLLMRQGRRLESAEHLRQLCRLGNVEELELRSLLVGMVALPSDSVRDELEPIGVVGTARYQISQRDQAGALKTLESTSESQRASSLLGRVYAEGEDFDRLTTWFSNRSDLSTKAADEWVAKGVYFAHVNDHAAAVRSFAEAILLDPTDKFAYISMSRSLEKLGAVTEAQATANRAQLIAETQFIGEQMASHPSRDEESISSLIRILEQLQRPFEALCWRALLVMFSPSIDQSQRETMIEEINRTRLDLLRSPDPLATREFLLCGVDVDSFVGSLISPSRQP